MSHGTQSVWPTCDTPSCTQRVPSWDLETPWLSFPLVARLSWRGQDFSSTPFLGQGLVLTPCGSGMAPPALQISREAGTGKGLSWSMFSELACDQRSTGELSAGAPSSSLRNSQAPMAFCSIHCPPIISLPGLTSTGFPPTNLLPPPLSGSSE